MTDPKNSILAEFSNPMHKVAVQAIADKCARDVEILEVVFKLCFHNNPSVCFRASWVLETLAVRNVEAIHPVLTEFMNRFETFKLPSCMRHVSRIIIVLNSLKGTSILKDTYLKADLQIIVEVLFAWLVDDQVPVAVKANCMEALAGFSSRYPWVKEELIATVEYLRDRTSIAFYGREKKVLPKLLKT